MKCQLLTLKRKVLKICKSAGVEVDVLILEWDIVPNFKAAVVPEEKLMIVSPNMAKESYDFLVNVITHELGHILAGHNSKSRARIKKLKDVVALEREANKHAIKLFRKLCPNSKFYYNHKDKDRMKHAFKYYTRSKQVTHGDT